MEGNTSTTETDKETPAVDQTPAWVKPRIDQLTREKNELMRQLQAANEKLLAKKEEQPPADGKKKIDMNDPEVQALISETASSVAFNQTCQSIFDKGVEEHGDAFKIAVNNIREKTAGLNPQVVAAAIATGSAHDVIKIMGDNPDIAQQIIHTPPLKMALEMSKLLGNKGKKSKKDLPPPVDPIGGGGKPPSTDEGNLPIDAWMAKREKEVRENPRRGRR